MAYDPRAEEHGLSYCCPSREHTPETGVAAVFAVILLHPILLLVMSTDNYHIIQTCNFINLSC